MRATTTCIQHGSFLCTTVGVEAAASRELWEIHGQEFLNMHTGGHSTAWRDSFRLPPEVRRRLVDEFQAADVDCSGALDAQELGELFRKLGIVVPAAVGLHTALLLTAYIC